VTVQTKRYTTERRVPESCSPASDYQTKQNGIIDEAARPCRHRLQMRRWKEYSWVATSW
jgi:hypothetical protein